MKLNLTLTCGLAVLFLCALAARAAQLGDPAPPLQIETWIKGQPVNLTAARSNKIVVVEFWATWCPPCRASIPHLTQLQRKYKDKVVFVGVSDEDAATVRPFVNRMGTNMDYTVAVDRDRKTGEAYMGAFGINGIPHAFIVDPQGRIVWNGHPMGGLEKTLDAILAGKFDLDTERKREAAGKKLEAFYEMAATNNDEEQIVKAAKELEALDQELGGIEPGEKFDAAKARQEIKFQKALEAYSAALASGQNAAELEKLEKAAKEYAPKDFDLSDFKESINLRQTFAEYYAAVTGQGDKEKIPALAKKLGETKSKDAPLLNQCALVILTDENIKPRDLELATMLAKAAVDSSGDKEPATLVTYAHALFESGKIKEAITYQQKAVSVAGDDNMKKDIEATLKSYQEKSSAR